MLTGPTNLPARRTRLIGREADVAAVRDLVLHGDGRLVTVTGTGGIGKTSLASEVARDLHPMMPDGTWLVDLADVSEIAAVADACSDALGLLDQKRPAEAIVSGFLAPRHALLYLDNCEHLADAVAAFVDHLLDDAADLHVLATSRVPLHVRGEAIHQLDPMAIPGADLGRDALARLPAVQLFVERAQAVRRDFELTPDDAPAVAAICRRLDGLPLAIELAASRVASMTAGEIADHLERDGSLAEGGRTTGPDRQRTVEATIDWSHRLLDPTDQVLFRRLAVFADGWTAEAATAVCDPDAALGVSDGLGRLTEHSLVVHESHDGRSRFRFLEPIGEFAATRLDRAAEREGVAEAHARWALAIAGHRGAGRYVPSPEDVERIDAQAGNIEAALTWAERSRSVDIAVGIALSMMEYWGFRGQLRLLRRHLETVLELLEGAPPSPTVGWLQTADAVSAQVRGEHDRARARASAAVAIGEAFNDDRGLRAALGVLGNVQADLGDFAGAREIYERVRVVVDRTDDPVPHGFWAANVGSIALRAGDLDEAEALLDEACRHFRAAEPIYYLGNTLAQLAAVARLRGDLDRAGDLIYEALVEARRYRAIPAGIDGLDEAGFLALGRGDARRAATLLGATSQLRDATGIAATTAQRQALDERIEDLRRRMSTMAFEGAWAHGRSLSFDEAVSVAAAHWEGPASASAGATAPLGSALTPREREVADLVAEGLSNAGIAGRLAIAPGTARIHVERIREKLGCTSRVQVAAWVLRQSGAAASTGASEKGAAPTDLADPD